MFKKIVASLALLLSLSSPALADTALCVGQNIAPITKDLKSAGAALVKWGVEECGGGTGPTGQPLAKWKCFVQYWRITPEVASMVIYERDPVDKNNWVLNGIMVNGEVLPLPPCKEPAPKGSPLPRRDKQFPGDPVDRNL